MKKKLFKVSSKYKYDYNYDQLCCIYSRSFKSIHISANQIDSNNLIELIDTYRNFKWVYICIKEESNIIEFLRYWKTLTFLNLISIKFKFNPELFEYVDIKETIDELKSLGKRVIVIYP